jgi:YVTN family beta-propeller protein
MTNASTLFCGAPRPLAKNLARRQAFHTTGIRVLGFLLAAAPVFAQFAYVPNAADHTVSVINTSTNTIAPTIPLPDPSRVPLGVAVSPSGLRAYIGNTCDNEFVAVGTCLIGEPGSISVIDTVTNAVIQTIPIPSEPSGLAVTQDETRLYVVNACNGDCTSPGGAVSVIDIASGSPTENQAIGSIPLSGSISTGIAVSQNGSRLYVSSFFGDVFGTVGAISVIDTATRAVVATVQVPAGPIGMVLSPVKPRLYVASFNGPIFAIDTTSNTLIKSSLEVIGGIGITVKPDGSRLYTSDFTGRIVVTDTGNDNLNTVASVATAGLVPAGIAAHPDGARVYAAGFPQSVVILNTATNTLSAAPVTVGQMPTGFGQFIASPSAGAIPALIALVKSFNLKDGIANSLDAKLANALAALTSFNAGQRKDAANQLQAFINSVEAQRGKAITNLQADQLVTLARQITASMQLNPVLAPAQSAIAVKKDPAGVSGIQGLIQVVRNMDRKQGVDSSLDAKMQRALAALAAAKAGDRQNALAQLQEFISVTNAQRRVTVTNVQANLLVKMAERIIAVI